MKKQLIVLLGLLFVSQHAFAFKASSCLRLLSHSSRYNSGNIDLSRYFGDIDGNTGGTDNRYIEIIKDIRIYLGKVIDLRVKASKIREDHKEIYGEYKAKLAEKEQFDKQISSLEDLKQKTIDKYIKLIQDISPNYSNDYANELRKKYTKDQEKEVKAINKQLKRLKRKKKKADKRFYKALAKWAPYKEEIDSLKELENKLLNALERLAQLIRDQNPSLRPTIDWFRHSYNSTGYNYEDDQEDCNRISDLLDDFNKDVISTNPYTFIPKPKPRFNGELIRRVMEIEGIK